MKKLLFMTAAVAVAIVAAKRLSKSNLALEEDFSKAFGFYTY